MNKKIIWVAGGVVVVGVGIYFGNMLYKQYQLLAKTDYKFISYKPISINKDSFKIEVVLQITNVSDLQIILKGYQFEIYVNNTWVSTVASSVAQTIVPNNNSVLTLLIDIIPTKVGDIDFLTGLLLNYQNATITVKGKLSATIGKVTVNRVPVKIGPTRLRDMLPTTTNATPLAK